MLFKGPFRVFCQSGLKTQRVVLKGNQAATGRFMPGQAKVSQNSALLMFQMQEEAIAGVVVERQSRRRWAERHPGQEFALHPELDHRALESSEQSSDVLTLALKHHVKEMAGRVEAER